MRSTVICALFALLLAPAIALAQANQQAAAPPGPASASPVSSRAGSLTREQYIQRAQERAAKRASAQFDRMDGDHNGVLDPAERRAWRSQHPRSTGGSHPAPAQPQ